MMRAKKIVFVLIAVLTVSLFASCALRKQETVEASEGFRFVILSENHDFGTNETIMYDKETKVIYAFYRSGYGGGLTPLYNADGTLLLYEVSNPENK